MIVRQLLETVFSMKIEEGSNIDVMISFVTSWWVIIPTILIVSLITFVEVLFYLYFRYVMVPFANKRLPHGAYKHYGRYRHKYFVRIMERLIRQSITTGTHPLFNCCMYMLQWYEYDPVDPTTAPPPIEVKPVHELPANLSWDDEENEAFEEYFELLQKGMDSIRKDDADAFICWALFGKHRKDLVGWEEEELAKAHEKGEDRFGLACKPGAGAIYKPRVLLSLEDCVAIHRPLMFYGAVALFKQCGYWAYQQFGFQLLQTKTGVRCWYKPGDAHADADATATDSSNHNLLPILLFQGVAPGGPALYLPLVVAALARDGRAVFVFECEAVSCTLNFDCVISEDDTIAGIEQIVQTHIPNPNQGLCIMGHSFGSCQLTWLLHSSLRDRIHQLVLLEPVSLMLSESDVILNIQKPILRWAVDIVLEWFIRRKFTWYNSELWLDDIPEHTQVIICLADKDPIVNSSKIKAEVESYSIVDPKFAERTKLLYINYVPHGNCLINPYTWRDIREALLQQELLRFRKTHNKSSHTREKKKIFASSN